MPTSSSGGPVTPQPARSKEGKKGKAQVAIAHRGHRTGTALTLISRSRRRASCLPRERGRGRPRLLQAPGRVALFRLVPGVVTGRKRIRVCPVAAGISRIARHAGRVREETHSHAAAFSATRAPAHFHQRRGERPDRPHAGPILSAAQEEGKRRRPDCSFGGPLAEPPPAGRTVI